MANPAESELRQIASTDTRDAAAVRAAALHMEALLLGEVPLPSEDSTLRLGQEVVRATATIYETYETDLETEFAGRLLQDEVTVEDYPMYERFRRLVAKEVEAAKINPGDKVLFIGSGPFPISPILIHELSGGAAVNCFDLSPEACGISQEVLEKLGLDDKVKVVNLRAESARLPSISTPGDMGDHDVVVVALLAHPKTEILHTIWRSMGPYPRIVLRSSEGNRRLLYAGADPNIVDHRRFKITGEYHAGIDDTISGTVLRTAAQPSIFRI